MKNFKSRSACVVLVGIPVHARLVHIFLRAPLRKREMRQHDTPLIAAAFLGRLADVAALLADGADGNEPNSDGWMPLHVACEEDGARGVKVE